MINRHIGYFCIVLYDEWMISQTVNWSDLLCIVFGFRVRTSQKCILYLLFVCLPFFEVFRVGEEHIFLRVVYGESARDPSIFWLGASDIERAVLTP